jgi:hypothetical protein
VSQYQYVCLHSHIIFSRKSAKALNLFKELLSSKITPENASDFLGGITTFFSWTGADISNEILNSAVELMQVVHDSLNMFTAHDQFQVRTWMLLSVVRKDLVSDDSFVFSKACASVLNGFLEESVFPSPVSPEEEPPPPTTIQDIAFGNGPVKTEGFPIELRRRRINAVFVCMRVAFRLYKRAAWAKQPVDKLFTEVSRKRLRMDEDQRNEADELTTMITASHRKMTSSGTQQNIRTFDSTAHPLISKNVGLLR